MTCKKRVSLSVNVQFHLSQTLWVLNKQKSLFWLRPASQSLWIKKNNDTNMNQDGLCFPVTLKSQETGQQLDLVKDCLDPKLKFPA